MSETKPPAFQFYAADWLTDTMAMSIEGRGAYITLLAYSWINGSIPKARSKLARVCGVDEDTMAEAMEEIGDKFIDSPDGGSKLINPRLERERDKQRAFRQQRIEAGKRSAERRRTSVPTSVPTRDPTGGQREGNPTSTSTSTSTTTSNINHPPGGSPPRTDDDEKRPKRMVAPWKDIIALYHEKCPALPTCRVVSQTRKTHINTRWIEDKKRQNLDWWGKYFAYVSSCNFLTGDNSRGWQADIDFLIKPRSMIRVIEGHYEDKTNGR